MLSRNLDLPELPIWQARSFYAQILLTLSVLLNVAGIDLFALLADMGLGATPEEVLASGDRAVAAWQQIAPLVFGLWAWIERQAPNFRLVWWRAPKAFDLVGGWAVLALGLMLSPGTSAAQAQAVCLPWEDMQASLASDQGEAVIWVGVMAPDGFVAITAAPAGGSWSVVIVGPKAACIALGGTDWAASAGLPLPGQPG